MDIKTLENDLLLLPVEEKLSLIDHLVNSITVPINSEIEKAWQEEIKFRVESVMDGSEEGITETQVWDSIEAEKKEWK